MVKSDDEGGILGNVLRGIGELVELVQKMDAEGKTEISRVGTIGDLQGRRGTGACYGFTLRTGLPGKKERVGGEFVQTGAGRESSLKKSEPVIDVFDEGGFIRIVAELPVVSDDEVAVKIKENLLNITVLAREASFSKSIVLPKKVKPGTMRKSIRNGILEVLVDVQGNSQ